MAITLTEAAARHISKSLAKRGKGLGVRLGVKTTGCSGMAYTIEYVDAPQTDDSVFELCSLQPAKSKAKAMTTSRICVSPHV